MRLKFKEWLLLGEKSRKIILATEKKDILGVATAIMDYVSYGSKKKVDDLTWYETARLHEQINKDNEIKLEIPLVVNSSDTKSEDEPWGYEGRLWYAWAGMFAKSYGWTLEYIAELEVEDALALGQEILVNEQLEKEWSWGLSEIAYPYDKASGKSKFQPLNRPLWMKKRKTVKTRMKMPKSWIPAGIVLMGSNESIKPI